VDIVVLVGEHKAGNPVSFIFIVPNDICWGRAGYPVPCRSQDGEGEDEAEERKDGEGEDEAEERKDGEGEDEEEEGGWDPSIDEIDGSQIWFSEDEADYNEEVNEENDDEETVLLDQNEEGRGL
jgi:hypothetical protein